ncbi:MAG: ABC transporter permease [Escherichia coli]
MAAKRTMLWLLVWRALRLRFQRVSVVFAALMVGATIVTALFAVWFDINTKMSEELRTFGANFTSGRGTVQYAAAGVAEHSRSGAAGLVHGASPWLYGMARTELEKVVMVGVWFESLQKLVPYWQVTGSWIGVSFDDRNAMIGVKLAERLNVQPGDSITLVDHNQRKNLQIKGIVESGDATDNMLIVSLDVAQAWLHQPGKISHGLLSVSNDVGRWRTMPAGCRRSILTWRFVRCVRSLLPKGRCWIKLKV